MIFIYEISEYITLEYDIYSTGKDKPHLVILLACFTASSRFVALTQGMLRPLADNVF